MGLSIGKLRFYNIRNIGLPVFSILLIPLWWGLGVDFFVYHLVALIIFLRRPSIVLPRDYFQLFTFLLVAILLFSLAFNFVLGSTDSYRLLASANNISILVVGYIYYSYFKLRFREEGGPTSLFDAGKLVSYLFILLALLLFFLFTYQEVEKIEFSTLFGMLTPDFPGLLGEYQNVTLVKQDFFNGESTSRLFIMAPFATGSALLCVLVGYFGYSSLCKRPVLYRLVYLSLIFFSVSLTLTRGAIVALAFGFLVIFLLQFRGQRVILLLSFIPLFLVVAFFFLPELFLKVNSMRGGSSSTRFLVYDLSLKAVLSYNPLIGFGIKPHPGDLIIPLGSHSSFLSILVRSGFLGFFIFFIAFVVIPFSSVLKISRKLLFSTGLSVCYVIPAKASIVSYVSILAFIILQDIDAYASLAVLIFSSFAVLFYFSKTEPVKRV